ncbi:hypothetical protein CcCBS67573_g07983 [Chytriomyces confervae]|uniref:Transglutaminase-like domain-containing protein n=1 Tax=Chytriomyces confervae TaxID=246404 RepID=A0A507ERC3_9FUNG|nr:hypothetical protein CcCBS67573_g07983 [Chytriomyces confervae]
MAALSRSDIDAVAADITAKIKLLSVQRRNENQSATSSIRNRLRGEIARFKSAYCDRAILDLALEQMPVDELHERAESITVKDGGYLECLMSALLGWFKTDYMTWVNNLPCEACGAPDTVSAGSGIPTPTDLADGASRTELFKCPHCHATSRFPRFNNVKRLMKTRKGRCGEWANLFTCFSIAMGFETRYVMDYTDHVWCEFYSDTWKRWVHVDPCEGSSALDQPLMYEVGWGKKLTYVFAVGEHEVVDVYRRYTRNLPDILRRRKLARETTLAHWISEMNSEIQRNLPASIVKELKEKSAAELHEFLHPPNRPLHGSEKIGRQSGNLEWRLARGETSGVASASARPVPAMVGPKVISNATEFSLVGSAKKTQSAFSRETVHQLTPNANDQRGAIWTRIQVPKTAEKLTLEFTFRIGNGSNQSSADGLALVFQSSGGPNALGEGGSGLGYAGISSSVAVEFDTYASRDTCADPDGNHVSVQTCGRGKPNSGHHRYSVGCSSQVPELGVGKMLWVRVAVDLSNAKRGLEVFMKEGVDEEYAFVVHGNVDVRDVVLVDEQRELYVGFTAATGGLSQVHEISTVEAVLE